MNIVNSLEWRYATKKFDSSKKLSNQQIETLKKAFNLTATSFGLQPIKMIVINNKELQEKFVPLSYFQRQVADASHLLVLCIENDTTSADINSYFDLEKKVRGVDETVISDFRKQLVEMYENKTVEERNLSVDEVMAALHAGTLLEVFGTGTAVTICHISHIGYQGKTYELPAIENRDFSNKVNDHLANIRKGSEKDKFGWIEKVG